MSSLVIRYCDSTSLLELNLYMTVDQEFNFNHPLDPSLESPNLHSGRVLFSRGCDRNFSGCLSSDDSDQMNRI